MKYKSIIYIGFVCLLGACSSNNKRNLNTNKVEDILDTLKCENVLDVNYMFDYFSENPRIELIKFISYDSLMSQKILKNETLLIESNELNSTFFETCTGVKVKMKTSKGIKVTNSSIDNLKNLDEKSYVVLEITENGQTLYYLTYII